MRVVPLEHTPALMATQTAAVQRCMPNLERGAARLLVIDDCASVRKILKAGLGLQGYHVITATNGEDGLEQLNAHPDVVAILCDMGIPSMNGQQFVLAARKRGYKLPFV